MPKTTKTAAPKKSVRKAAPKKVVNKKKTTPKKVAAKKTPTKKAAAAKPSVSPTQLDALRVLSKSKKSLTRSQISKALDGKFIGGDVMGHCDESKLKESSLVGRGLAKFAASEDGSSRAHYAITAAGRNVVSKA